MSDAHGNDNRNAMITRFVIVYVICILCAIVPLYYLFNMAEVVPAKLSLPKKDAKNETMPIVRFRQITLQLDSTLDKKNMATERGYILDKMYRFVTDTVDKANPYKSMYLTFYELYKYRIAISDQLRTRTDSLNSELVKCRNENKSLKEEKESYLKIISGGKSN
jgi:hypothetical protein